MPGLPRARARCPPAGAGAVVSQCSGFESRLFHLPCPLGPLVTAQSFGFARGKKGAILSPEGLP